MCWINVCDNRHLRGILFYAKCITQSGNKFPTFHLSEINIIPYIARIKRNIQTGILLKYSLELRGGPSLFESLRGCNN